MSVGTEVNISQEGVPDVIPAEACYLGWQESLALLTKLVEAAKRTKRVVQVGSQQRTMAVNRTACEFLRNGGLGKISLVEMPNYAGPAICPTFESEPPADGLVRFSVVISPNRRA